MVMNRLALLLAATPLVIGGIGFVVPGNALANQSALLAQNSPQPNGQRGEWRGKGPGFAQALGLSEDQQARLKAIHESTRQQIDAVFTAEQREQLNLARQQRQRPNFNLSEAQQTQIRTIRDNAKTQMDAVLTDQQRQRLQELRQQKPQRGQGQGQGQQQRPQRQQPGQQQGQQQL